MRISDGTKAALIAAAAGLALAACTSGSDTDASAAASSASDAISSIAVDVSGIVDDVRTASECASWAGGKMAGEGVVAGWEYTCDEDGDGTPEATVAIYVSQDDLDSDLATVEAASSDTGIATGDHFIFTTTDPDQLAAVADLGGEVVREVP
ncbi:hypothetical protein QQX09_02630 [Demequina sp. SYSU T00192]|uniref:Lipoprotein n=1 Tax=Demequina litoralis TaxID=3051660 RepID=A0ABT8G6H5_9MICO|nr:hypothetical protein [Demequina sp. SYSU T00192]MDN4474746.1 hypothetical protein [Demequina sp. SYSU T00192]